MKSKAAVISALVLFGLVLSSCDKKNASLVNRRTATSKRIEEIRVSTAKAEYLAAVEVYKAAVREFLRSHPPAPPNDSPGAILLFIAPLSGWEEGVEHFKTAARRGNDDDDEEGFNPFLFMMAMFDARDKAKAAGVLERLGALGVSIRTLEDHPSEFTRIVYDLFGFRLPSPPGSDEEDEGGGVAA
ncbi:hypothetical protein AGMMS50233_01020 [Endomicrobiia bacterium]|nr:hypothetical protein AGMMS50233_01020 [Endomicrobiia bacterium]